MNDTNEKSVVDLINATESAITDTRLALVDILALLTGENIVEKPDPVTPCSMLADMQIMRFRAEELAEMATRVNEILAGKED